MVKLGFDAFATFVVIVAPIAIVLFLILVVVAYPWLLLVPLGIWYLNIKYMPDEVAPAEVAEVHESSCISKPKLVCKDNVTGADTP